MNTQTKLRPTRQPVRGADTCAGSCFRKELVDDLKDWLPADAGIGAIATLHGVLADPTHLKVLLALSQDELCVCEVALVLDLSVSAASHQLRVLRNLGVVNSRQKGKMVYYSLPEGNAIMPWIGDALTHQRDTQ